MALGALTLSTTAGVKGRRFSATIQGLTTGRVEVLNDGSPGFSVVNGRVMSQSLPYDTSTVVLREYEPGVGQGYRDTRIDISAASAPTVSDGADGIVVIGGGGGAPTAKTATATTSGPVYTYQRLLGSSSTIALVAGSNANLTLNTTSGVISATAALSPGASQTATVRESLSGIAVEVPITITGATPTPTPGPTPTLRQVATRCRVPRTFNASVTKFNSRSAHVARDDITALKIGLPNWFANAANGETVGGGAITYTAAVEYPSGVYTQVLFSGQPQCVVQPGDTTFSDFTNVNIPNGTKFRVRIFGNGPSGIVYYAGLSNPVTDQVDESSGEGMEFGAGVVDATMGGTITANSTSTSATMFGPIALVAVSLKPALLMLGDSRVCGHGDGYGHSATPNDDLGEYRRFGQVAGYINLGTPSETGSGFMAARSRRSALAAYCTHVAVNYGYNDIANNSASAASTIAVRQAVAALFPDKKVIGSTLSPSTTSTDAWATEANQTVNARTSELQAFNQAVRQGIAGYASMIDLAAAVESVASPGKWAAPPALTGDGVHARLAGYDAYYNYIDPMAYLS